MAQSGKSPGKSFRDFIRYAGIFSALLCMFFLCAASAFAQSKLAFKATDTIEELRDKIKNNGYNFTVGHTRIYDLPADQKLKMFKSRIAPPPEKRIMAPHSDVLLGSKMRRMANPAKFDWRNYNGHSYVGPVRDQGNLGSCYSFGAAAAAETAYNVSKGLYDANAADFAEMYIIWTLSSVAPYSGHFGGDDGADYEYYELYGLTSKGPPEGAAGFEGIIAETDFAYSDSKNSPGAATINNSKSYPRVRFKEWKRVYPANYADTTEQMKAAIATYGAIDVAVQTDSAFDAYTGGIYENTNTAPDKTPYYYTTTDHAVSLVGWDDDPNGDNDTSDGCWILRNSWGATDWGENGYMRIKYFSAAVNTSAAYLVPETASGPYAISGAVSGAVQAEVTVSLTGAFTAATITAADGAYSFTGLADGAYTITPAKSGYFFNPASSTVTLAGGSQAGFNFTATTGSSTTTTAATTTTTTEATTTVPSTTTTDDRRCLAKQVLGADNPKLENLRAFRDSKLAQSSVGRRIIHIYYNNAGSINDALERSPELRTAARTFLEAIAQIVVR